MGRCKNLWCERLFHQSNLDFDESGGAESTVADPDAVSQHQKLPRLCLGLILLPLSPSSGLVSVLETIRDALGLIIPSHFVFVEEWPISVTIWTMRNWTVLVLVLACTLLARRDRLILGQSWYTRKECFGSLGSLLLTCESEGCWEATLLSASTEDARRLSRWCNNHLEIGIMQSCFLQIVKVFFCSRAYLVQPTLF